MVKKTSTTKKAAMVPKKSLDIDPPLVTTTPPRRLPFLKIAIGLVLIFVLGWWLLNRQRAQTAATVNGVPISRAELNSKLIERFGDQTLEALIGERLISQEAAKQNISATKEELTAKITEIEKTLAGSMSLDESLKMQGISRAEFETQMRMQLLIEKLLADQATSSASEVAEYITTNKASLMATTAAEQQLEAEREIRNNKMASAFSEWFTKLKEQAKIERFLQPATK